MSPRKHDTQQNRCLMITTFNDNATLALKVTQEETLQLRITTKARNAGLHWNYMTEIANVFSNVRTHITDREIESFTQHSNFGHNSSTSNITGSCIVISPPIHFSRVQNKHADLNANACPERVARRSGGNERNRSLIISSSAQRDDPNKRHREQYLSIPSSTFFLKKEAFLVEGEGEV